MQSVLFDVANIRLVTCMFLFQRYVFGAGSSPIWPRGSVSKAGKTWKSQTTCDNTVLFPTTTGLITIQRVDIASYQESMRNLWKAELLCARSAIAILIYPRTQPHRHVGLVHRAMCSAWSIDVGFDARRCLEMMVHWRKMNGMHVYCDAVLAAYNSWKALSIWQPN